MRVSVSRLVVFVVGVAAIVSCEGGNTPTTFGNGISGGATGTAPVVPVNPNSPDTNRPFVRIDTPATTGALVNIGDSILTVVRISDDRQLTALTIQGMKFTGNAGLGTQQTIVRYPGVVAPVPGSPPFRTGLTDTVIRRYLKPGIPVDSTVDSLIIMAIAQDAAGNVDTTRRRLQLVTGPAVTLLAPTPNDSVPQTVNMTVTARVQHTAGVRTVNIRVAGDASWPTAARTAFDTVFRDTVVGVQRDVTFSHLVTVPLAAVEGSRITITATATDIASNPGGATPVIVFVRRFGTSAPRVTQNVPDRLELTDSIIINAVGDNIDSLGFTVIDSTGAVLKDSTVKMPAPLTGNASRGMRLNLPSQHQGKRVRITSHATDLARVRGYSIPIGSALAQSSALLAHADSALIVYGQTYKLPRTGVVGDLVVDTVRSHVLVSNMDANRLEVWDNATRVFDPIGVAVGSQPWGLAVSINPSELLVANSGGTNISRVNLGTGAISTIREDLSRRIRTRNNFVYVTSEAKDAAGAVHFSPIEIKMYSDRPQYIGQIIDGTIYFSTRPTTQAPEGTIRYLDPTQPFPDLRTYIFVKNDAGAVENFVVVNADSITAVKGGSTSIPDTIYMWDHVPGSTATSVFVKTPTCTTNATPGPNITPCGPLGAGDPRFDARFPQGLAQGILSAAIGMLTYTAACRAELNAGTYPTSCSDVDIIKNATPVGFTDTTFVSVSADRNWIAFGEGNTAPGNLFMASAVPQFSSPLLTQKDLTNQAAERVFGLAIDSTGQTVAAHGSSSYLSSVDDPFHLRLQGIYGDAGSGGAGIAYHPRANGISSPECERLIFVAAGDRTVHAADIAYFIRRGRFDLKHQLYGPLRVSRALAGDNPPGTTAANLIRLKLYGISLEGGLTVIDLRDSDISKVPGETSCP